MKGKGEGILTAVGRLLWHSTVQNGAGGSSSTTSHPLDLPLFVPTYYIDFFQCGCQLTKKQDDCTANNI